MHLHPAGLTMRYEKTGTPLNKELREYVEELSKTKAAAKVEPEEVGLPEQELSETVASGSFVLVSP